MSALPYGDPGGPRAGLPCCVAAQAQDGNSSLMISPTVTGFADFIWSSVTAALVSGAGDGLDAKAGGALVSGFDAGAAAPVSPLSCGIGDCGISRSPSAPLPGGTLKSTTLKCGRNFVP